MGWQQCNVYLKTREWVMCCFREYWGECLQGIREIVPLPRVTLSRGLRDLGLT